MLWLITYAFAILEDKGGDYYMWQMVPTHIPF